MMTPPPLNLFYFGDLLFVASPLPSMGNDCQFAIVWRDEDHPSPGIYIQYQNGDVVGPLDPEEQKKHFVSFRRQVLQLPEDSRAIFKKAPEVILSPNLSYLDEGFNCIELGPDNPDEFEITEKILKTYTIKR